MRVFAPFLRVNVTVIENLQRVRPAAQIRRNRGAMPKYEIVATGGGLGRDPAREPTRVKVAETRRAWRREPGDRAQPSDAIGNDFDQGRRAMLTQPTRFLRFALIASQRSHGHAMAVLREVANDI